MSPSRVKPALYGSAAGGAIALALLAIFTGRFASASVVAEGGIAGYEVTTGALYLAVVVAGALGGVLIGALAYAYGRSTDPHAARFPLGALLPVAAVTGALFAYAVLRFGVGAAGDITNGVASISVVRMVVVALLMGLAAGGITAAVTDALARPALIGFEGEAAPASVGAMMTEMARAIGAPLIALILGAVFAVALAQVLLELGGAGAVAVFSIVAALVLGGATLAALRPWQRFTGR